MYGVYGQVFVNMKRDRDDGDGHLIEKFLNPKNATSVKRTRNANSSISQTLRKRVWELYIGIGVSEATCPLCGMTRISKIQNSGFQACHIVADKFLSSTTTLTVFDLFPGCQICNNECADICILDYLYGRERYVELRRLIWNVFTAFMTQHEAELSQHEGLCWRVIQHLYGRSRYPAGGGIANEKQIYEIARTEQYAHLVQDAREHTLQLHSITERMVQVMSSDIKPMKLLV